MIAIQLVNFLLDLDFLSSLDSNSWSLLTKTSTKYHRGFGFTPNDWRYSFNDRLEVQNVYFVIVPRHFYWKWSIMKMTSYWRNNGVINHTKADSFDEIDSEDHDQTIASLTASYQSNGAPMFFENSINSGLDRIWVRPVRIQIRVRFYYSVQNKLHYYLVWKKCQRSMKPWLLEKFMCCFLDCQFILYLKD